MRKITGQGQVLHVIDVHPVAMNVLDLGCMTVGDQPVDQFGEAFAFQAFFTELLHGQFQLFTAIAPCT